MYFLDSNSFSKISLVRFRDFSHLIILFIAISVIIIIVFLVINLGSIRILTDLNYIETIWTIAPCFILIALAFPRLLLLYTLDSPSNLVNNLNIIGRQWYWIYNSSNFNFESYISNRIPRLLNVDNAAIIYDRTLAIVSRGDVLHRWAVPSIGIKVDAVPGRINFGVIDPALKGVFFGQCREICGANHAFIPIKLESI